MKHDLLVGLDEHQRQVVTHNQGPLLVLAGAGSGKTKVLTHRIARLVLEKICLPQQILAVTFTNKAAKEMKHRIQKLTTPAYASQMTVSTFHSLGARLLREFGSTIGLSPHFSIIDDSERISTLKSVIRTSGKKLDKDNRDEIATSISLAKNASLEPEAYKKQNPDETRLHRIYKTYSAMLLKRQSVDFDDLLLMPLKIIKSKASVLETLRERYTFLCIDEFQDTNVAQMEFMKLLASPLNNLMVVGDDDQSIYSWRGAHIDNILSFSAQFSGCKTVVLSHNYRSTQHIVDGALSVIQKNTQRKLKQIKTPLGPGLPIVTCKADDEKDEIQWILDLINTHQRSTQFSYSDHALLFRTNTVMDAFEQELRVARIPYKVFGSISFFDRKEIKDVCAYLRFFANFHDELSLERVLKVPNRGISTEAMNKIEDLASLRKISLWEAFEQYNDLHDIDPGQIERIKSLVLFYQRHAATFQKGHLSATLKEILAEIGYCQLLEKAYKSDPSLKQRLENVAEIVTALEKFESKKSRDTITLSNFLQEYSLITVDDSKDKAENKGVVLMTIHKAKGLEFPVVILPYLDDSLFPSPQACLEGKIEEERRLFYVAMTRAKKKLILTYPQIKNFRKKIVPVKPCRFIFEIPDEFLECPVGEKQQQEYDQFLDTFFSDLKKKFEVGQ